jgi:hypothetical protein
MTRIQVLQDARAEWVEKLNAAKETTSEIYAREQNAIKDALLPFFEDFSEGVIVEVMRGSVYFKMFDPERGYNKEIFSLYLKEDWSGDRSFRGVSISYYTTSTNGEDTWELERLFLLGKVAGIVRWKQDEIVDAANRVKPVFKEEYEVAFQLQNMISTAISEIDNKVRRLTRERVEYELMKDGIEFTEGRNIDLKYNYSPRVISIKLIDFSKSGKKATAVFVFAHGTSTSREENCSVEKIVEQVAYYYPNYAKDTKKELLPS